MEMGLPAACKCAVRGNRIYWESPYIASHLVYSRLPMIIVQFCLIRDPKHCKAAMAAPCLIPLMDNKID